MAVRTDQPVDTQNLDPEAQAIVLSQMAPTYPYLVEIDTAASLDEESVVGEGCDDQYEFEFALDLVLNGFERLKQQHTKSAAQTPQLRTTTA